MSGETVIRTETFWEQLAKAATGTILPVFEGEAKAFRIDRKGRLYLFMETGEVFRLDDYCILQSYGMHADCAGWFVDHLDNLCIIRNGQVFCVWENGHEAFLRNLTPNMWVADAVRPYTSTKAGFLYQEDDVKFEIPCPSVDLYLACDLGLMFRKGNTFSFLVVKPEEFKSTKS